MEILSVGTKGIRAGRQLIFILAAGLIGAASLSGQVNEYQVKAIFLYNFARYVEWPAQAFASPNDPIVLCVLGRNPFGTALEQAVAGKAVEGRTLKVQQISSVATGCNCHILFVNRAEEKKFQSAIASIKDSGILTVGESPEFARAGGVVNFKLEDGKVRFEINVGAATQERLHISSKLLNLAQIVTK